MSDSYRDQRGKRVNGEIWGRGEYSIGPGGKVYPAIGGSEVGSPMRKRDAKSGAARMRRREDRRLERSDED